MDNDGWITWTTSKVNADEARYRGARYGKKHGYFGMPNGDIWHEKSEKRVCKGWTDFYYMKRKVIDDWLKEIGYI